MHNLIQFCDQRDSFGYFINTPDHCQARVLRAFLVSSLLGGDTSDVRFYRDGVCFRHSMFA